MAEAIEVNQLEFVVEDFYDLLLKEPDKLEGEVCNFRENLTLNIVLPTGLRPGFGA